MLVEKQKELQRTAMKNWDARLAERHNQDYGKLTDDTTRKAPKKPVVGK